MKDKLEKTVFGLFGALGKFPTALTDLQQVRALLRKLRPHATQIDLLRLGPQGDGGYLVPDDLDSLEACYSPGVSDVSGFEKDCADRGMQVFMADKSVAGPAEQHERFHFEQKFVGAMSNEDFMTLDDWVDATSSNSTSDLLLQMDIEGAEYEAILAASPRLMQRCRIIVAEFHQVQFLLSHPFFGIASRAFEKILQTHTCVHIHPNNCCGSVAKSDIQLPRVMEFTFLRSDRIEDSTLATVFPHPLDADNTAEASLPLPKCWYGY